MTTVLSPSQQPAFAGITGLWNVGHVFSLWGASGSGRTTVAKKLAEELGAGFIATSDYLPQLERAHPLKLEETFYRLILDGLGQHDALVIDDADLLEIIGNGCGSYPRSGLAHGVFTAIAAFAEGANKKIVLVCHRPISSLYHRSWIYGIDTFKAEDYGFFFDRYLNPNSAKNLDVSKVYRFAPNLSARQISSACTFMSSQSDVTTDSFIEYLRSQHMTSNVRLQEVRQARFEDLRGVDDVIEQLEANIIMPLEDDELAAQLGIRPKRGVLLVGPPGTGKTTIGRALAHRLKSKFFLIDGTFIAGTSQFYNGVQQIFQAAKENAPSIIFIDDSDAIFNTTEELGLYRYLLTMLDGLESESQGHVCVMMTAMDVADLPPALIRSGRIELWLEMKLPDEEARLEILRNRCATLPDSLRPASLDVVVTETEDFTGADLARLVDDARTLLAYDRYKSNPEQPLETYLLKAIEGVRSNKAMYEEAASKAQAKESAGRGFSFGFPFGEMAPEMSVITHLSHGGYDGD